jgi:DNA-directed RNA polymerase subunit RPC12/RpoP
MSIRFACRCGKKLKAPDDKIGRKILCPECGSPVTVPDSSTVTVATVAAGASDTATDLLRGTGEKGKKPRPHVAFDDGTPDTETGYDFVESAKQLVLTVVPGVALIVLVCGGAYLISNAVMSSSPEHPDLAEVTGTVTLDGVPLVGANVEFRPDAGKKAGSKVGASTGLTDENGKYTLLFVRDIEGAALGRHEVLIHARDARGRRLPSEYNSQTELTAMVLEGENDIPFELTSER